jgi:hypothetical protein
MYEAKPPAKAELRHRADDGNKARDTRLLTNLPRIHGKFRVAGVQLDALHDISLNYAHRN